VSAAVFNSLIQSYGPGETMLDIGPNIKYFTLLMAQHADVSATPAAG
jgi:hypothetical protein